MYRYIADANHNSIICRGGGGERRGPAIITISTGVRQNLKQKQVPVYPKEKVGN
jgi:hypothetical protein